MSKRKLEKQAKEIAGVIFGVPADSIKKATFKEPILAGIMKNHVAIMREKIDEKILSELFKL